MRKATYAVKLLREFVRFAHENRIYWIIPLILLLALTGLFIAVGQGAAPLLYTLF